MGIRTTNEDWIHWYEAFHTRGTGGLFRCLTHILKLSVTRYVLWLFVYVHVNVNNNVRQCNKGISKVYLTNRTNPT